MPTDINKSGRSVNTTAQIMVILQFINRTTLEINLNATPFTCFGSTISDLEATIHMDIFSLTGGFMTVTIT